MKKQDFVVRFAGEGGQGVVTSAEGLAQAMAQSGYHVQTFSTFPSQIRGGPTWTQTRISTKEVLSSGDELDVLVAFNQYAYDNHKDDVASDGVIVYNSGEFEIEASDNALAMDFDELAKMKKNEILELISSEKYQSVLNLINLNPVKIPKSLTKELLLEKIKESFFIDEKIIKKLSKDELVNLAKLLEIVFYRGRFRMKVDDATKNNLINKITIEKKNKPLDTPQKALTIQSDEILDLFGTQK